jgi:hypothetical protein
MGAERDGGRPEAAVAERSTQQRGEGMAKTRGPGEAGDGGSEAVQLLLLPPERNVLNTEGNIVEFPYFELNSKRCFPKSNLTGLTKEQIKEKLAAAMRMRFSFVRYDKSLGARVEVVFEKVAHQDYGFAGDLAQRIFYLLVELWVAQNRPWDPRVYVSRKAICELLEISSGGETFKDIEGALKAMRYQAVTITNAWKTPQENSHRKQTVPGPMTVSLIGDFKFKGEKLTGRAPRFVEYLPILGEHDASGTPGPAPTLPYIELSHRVHESLQGRYIIPSDREYANALPPSSRRAYYLLNKWKGNDAERKGWPISLQLLTALLPIHQDSDAGRERVANAALHGLVVERQFGRRRVRFLAKYEWQGSRKDGTRKVLVWYEGRFSLEAWKKARAPKQKGPSEGEEQNEELESAGDAGEVRTRGE